MDARDTLKNRYDDLRQHHNISIEIPLLFLVFHPTFMPHARVVWFSSCRFFASFYVTFFPSSFFVFLVFSFIFRLLFIHFIIIIHFKLNHQNFHRIRWILLCYTLAIHTKCSDTFVCSKVPSSISVWLLVVNDSTFPNDVIFISVKKYCRSRFSLILCWNHILFLSLRFIVFRFFSRSGKVRRGKKWRTNRFLRKNRPNERTKDDEKTSLTQTQTQTHTHTHKHTNTHEHTTRKTKSHSKEQTKTKHLENLCFFSVKPCHFWIYSPPHFAVALLDVWLTVASTWHRRKTVKRFEKNQKWTMRSAMPIWLLYNFQSETYVFHLISNSFNSLIIFWMYHSLGRSSFRWDRLDPGRSFHSSMLE